MQTTAALRHAYYSNDDKSTQSWNYRIITKGAHDRRVCRHVYLLAYPRASWTLNSIQNDIKKERLYFDAMDAESGSSALGQSLGVKKAAVIGWFLQYAAEVGDEMPDDDKKSLVIPRLEWSHIYAEYAESESIDVRASPQYFQQVIYSAPELKHIRRACRLKGTFNICTTCLQYTMEICAALKAHDRITLVKVRAERQQHLDEQRAERIHYYQIRAQARLLSAQSTTMLSLILDKWDSNKTMVPFFTREPKSGWSANDSMNRLRSHVLGFIVHGSPNEHFLYSFNDTLRGDGNLNIEGLHRTLVKHCGAQPLPRTLYIQADNASDNKNHAVLLFCGLLICHKYVESVQISFLLVGHTHEDIDQLFSSLSRYIKSKMAIMDPIQFREQVKAGCGTRKYDYTDLYAVRDWTEFTKDYRNTSIVGIQKAIFESGDKRAPHLFKLELNDKDNVGLWYKEFSTDPVWLPPADSNIPVCEWTSSDTGINLFSTESGLPPDPFVPGAACVPDWVDFYV